MQYSQYSIARKITNLTSAWKQFSDSAAEQRKFEVLHRQDPLAKQAPSPFNLGLP